ncbi:MAG: 5'/3'-nucleotidase SurE [Phycisphaerae bacterium]|nr:5'/3'-nucleotidase SurE [Phycisphaerae bacterium]
MRILLTNDDGIAAPGLAAMWHEASQLGQVTVVAPAEGQSATGHGITVGEAVIASHVQVDGRFQGLSVTGRPADCVKLAVREVLDKPPDLVVSGINAGANVGINILYSGTVAAAVEAAFYRLPAVAVSLDFRDKPDYARAAAIAREVITALLRAKLKPGWLMNVNIPVLERGSPRGIRVARQSTLVMHERFVKAADPRGRTYFWLTGGFTDDGEPDSDLRAINEGYVAVTPLRVDLTCNDALDAMRQWEWPTIEGL